MYTNRKCMLVALRLANLPHPRTPSLEAWLVSVSVLPRNLNEGESKASNKWQLLLKPVVLNRNITLDVICELCLHFGYHNN